MHKLDETLQHWGVKGMKWGVITWRKKSGDSDTPKPKGKLAQKLDSMKRERQWRKILKDVDSLSTKEISTLSKRIGLENDLKTLSKSKIGTPKDKQDYIRRATMSNEELSRKVVRLRAKDNLYKKVNDASKEQREFGIKVTQIGGALATKFALTKSIQPKDVFDAVQNPKKASDKAKSDVLKKALETAPKETHDVLKLMLDQIEKAEKGKS